jgi:hypothetical protein
MSAAVNAAGAAWASAEYAAWAADAATYAARAASYSIQSHGWARAELARRYAASITLKGRSW